MTFENIEFKSIKGISINSVKTRMLGEMGFPVDVPPEPDMSHNIAFFNYASKIFEYPFTLSNDVFQYYIESLIAFYRQIKMRLQNEHKYHWKEFYLK